MARKGLLELRIRQSLTDDYALDAELKFGATGWLPAETALEQKKVWESDFDSSRCGGAWVDEKDPGLVHLVPYSARSIEIRRKDGKAWGSK